MLSYVSKPSHLIASSGEITFHLFGNRQAAVGDLDLESLVSQLIGNLNIEKAESVTNKQIQFLLSMSIAKRLRLTTPQIESRVAEILGRDIGLYCHDLTKQEAGIVLDTLTTNNDPKILRLYGYLVDTS